MRYGVEALSNWLRIDCHQSLSLSLSRFFFITNNEAQSSFIVHTLSLHFLIKFFVCLYTKSVDFERNRFIVIFSRLFLDFYPLFIY